MRAIRSTKNVNHFFEHTSGKERTRNDAQLQCSKAMSNKMLVYSELRLYLGVQKYVQRLA